MATQITLDFIASPPRPVAAWVCLLVGALLLAQVADRYAEVSDENERMEAQLARLKKQKKATAPKASVAQSARDENQKREQRLLNEADAGEWQSILAAVESAIDKDVALLSLNQETSAQRLRISAEVKSIDEAISFAERLRKNPKFSEVMLSGHENRKSTGMDVLGFTLLASWKK